MNKLKKFHIDDISKIINDSFYKSSMFILISQLLAAILGLAFWVVAAMFYSQEEIGRTTALVSAAALIITITRLGMEHSMIRFFPDGDQSKIFSTTVFISTICAVFTGTIFILGIDFFSPNLFSSMDEELLFLIYLSITSIASSASSAFIAARKSQYSAIQTILIGSRLIFIIPLISVGIIALFISYLAAYFISVVFSIIILYILRIKIVSIDVEYIRYSLHFSTANYLSGLLMTIPTMALPIVVFNILGAPSAGVYYITYSFATMMFMIPIACSTSLFVEGSYGEGLRRTIFKTIVTSYILLAPAFISYVLFGKWLLGLMGPEFVENGYELLLLFGISSFLLIIYQTYISIARIKKDSMQIIYMGVLNFCLLIGLSYYLIETQGILGIGYAWILSYGICAVAILFLNPKRS